MWRNPSPQTAITTLHLRQILSRFINKHNLGNGLMEKD